MAGPRELAFSSDAAPPSLSTSRTKSSVPTRILSPGAPVIARTRPARGEGISTVTLSVMTSTSGSSSATVAPTATCQPTTSASATPSPTSGSLNTKRPMSVLHRLAESLRDAPRTGEVVPLQRMRVGRVPAGDPDDGRLEAVEAVLLDERRELGTVPAGAGGLMDDHAASGLGDRGHDRVDVDRDQRAKVDDLGVHAALGHGCHRDMHHGPIGQDRH